MGPLSPKNEDAAAKRFFYPEKKRLFQKVGGVKEG
jgi:hypothetical protein